MQKKALDLSGADKAWAAACDCDPSHAGALSGRAAFLHKVRGDKDGAEALHQRALAAHPAHGPSLGAYAMFLFNARGNLVDAEALFKQAMRAAPRNATLLANYATVLKKVGKYAQSETMCVLPLPALLLLLLLRPHSPKHSLRYRAALHVEPSSVVACCNYAQLLTKVRNKPEKARDLLLVGLKQDPNNKMLRRNYAILLRDFPELRGGGPVGGVAGAVAAPDGEAMRTLGEASNPLFEMNTAERGELLASPAPPSPAGSANG